MEKTPSFFEKAVSFTNSSAVPPANPPAAPSNQGSSNALLKPKTVPRDQYPEVLQYREFTNWNFSFDSFTKIKIKIQKKKNTSYYIPEKKKNCEWELKSKLKSVDEFDHFIHSI